jgi:hypothetical protein
MSSDDKLEARCSFDGNHGIISFCHGDADANDTEGSFPCIRSITSKGSSNLCVTAMFVWARQFSLRTRWNQNSTSPRRGTKCGINDEMRRKMYAAHIRREAALIIAYTETSA